MQSVIISPKPRSSRIVKKKINYMENELENILNDNKLEFSGNNLNSLPYLKIYDGLNRNIQFSYINCYRINLLKLNIDEYYGFEIDGNRRFYLGDFTFELAS